MRLRGKELTRLEAIEETIDRTKTIIAINEQYRRNTKSVLLDNAIEGYCLALEALEKMKQQEGRQ